MPAPTAPAHSPRIALLVYEPLRQRRKDSSFLGNGNVGALVVADKLERSGLVVGRCSPSAAHLFDIVLVSLTSTYDVFALYRAVARLPSWSLGRRSFHVIAGGFGMQNPTAIRNFIDVAVFGRCEDFIVDVVNDVARGVDPQHESTMNPRNPRTVKIAQASQLYPEEVAGWKETFTGCPLKCKFCHYTYARKHLGSDEAYGYVQTTLTGGGTPELTWDQLFTWGKKLGRVRVAIDGFSEAIRYVYGKRISDDDISRGLERVGSYPGTTTVLTYNISNFPHESRRDEAKLVAAVKASNPEHRVIFVLHTTPFRPSIATPMQWEPVDISVDWSKRRAEVFDDRPNLRAVHSFTLETPFSHACSMVAERATEDSDGLVDAICFDRSLASGRHAERLERLVGRWSMSQYTREYEVGERLPAWFVRGYIDQPVIEAMARKMRLQRRMTVDDPTWVPAKGRGTIVSARLARAVAPAVVTDASRQATLGM